MANAEPDERLNILLIGDWVVDEYWYLAQHISDRSSHTGFEHYRVLSSETEVVSELCGAGRVARVLYFQLLERDREFAIHGLGNWHEDDTRIIRHLVHARNPDNTANCTAGLARFRLEYSVCEEEFPVHLQPLYKGCPTIRVIRTYHEGADGPRQLNRLDWEPKRTQRERELFPQRDWPPGGSIQHVVIHDLCKGAVTPEVVQLAVARYPEATWYIRSKVEPIPWLEYVDDEKIALNVIGPEVAVQLHPMESLLVNGEPTLEVMSALVEQDGVNCFILSDHREIVGRLGRDAPQLVTGTSGLQPSELNELGWPSSFFASMVNSMIGGSDGAEEGEASAGSSEKVALKAELALVSADDFSGVPLSDRWRVKVQRKSVKKAGIAEPRNWESVYRAWKDARQRLGLIAEPTGSKYRWRLDVWRGTSQIPGYVACMAEKEQVLQRIGRLLRGFRRGGASSMPLSIFLQADPGSGKTYLARKLAESFGYSFMRFDVTQMIRREDLLDIFDAVATRQARRETPLLVFVDEMNALLEGTQVYSAFLAPLEEGFYVRRGRTFSLNPCAWIFAGTRMEERERQELRRGEKLSDFESRMTLRESIDYSSLRERSGESRRFYEEARLEQVYLGVLLIRHYFPDVYEVSREVLEYFANLDPSQAPARRIRRLVLRLRNVQYGRVTRENCQEWEEDSWIERADGAQLVRLEFGDI